MTVHHKAMDAGQRLICSVVVYLRSQVAELESSEFYLRCSDPELKKGIPELRYLCAALGFLDDLLGCLAAALGGLDAVLWLLCCVLGSLVAVPWSESVELWSLAD